MIIGLVGKGREKKELSEHTEVNLSKSEWKQGRKNELASIGSTENIGCMNWTQQVWKEGRMNEVRPEDEVMVQVKMEIRKEE